MKLIKSLISICAITVSMCLTSCVEEEQFDNSTSGNLEALWKIMDEHYCFFDYKKAELGVDWNEVHQRYSEQAQAKLTQHQEFELLCSMIGELRDGHVNLSASFDLGRNWSWHEDYPKNFSDTLQRRYLGTDFKIASGLQYRILDDNIGYVYCGSFSNAIGASSLDQIMYYLSQCRGLIIDVRENGGGLMTAAETLAARFTNKEVHVGYMQHKTGTGHNDFSERKEQVIKPSSGIRWQKSVAVLTNRSVYSAANEFVKYMKELGSANGNIVLVGDKTGGGAGMPFSSELPNGWSVRLSACPMFDAQGNSTEHGIEPDYSVGITDSDFAKGRDTIIEYARTLLSTKTALRKVVE